MSYSMTVAISACLSAFGIGYAGGHLVRLARRAIESIE